MLHKVNSVETMTVTEKTAERFLTLLVEGKVKIIFFACQK
jgi:hypothetical protein